MSTREILENLNKVKIEREQEEVSEEINDTTKEEGLAGSPVDVSVIKQALSNKRGDKYVEQITKIENITKQEDGIVFQVTKMSGDATKKTGDFLTNGEVSSVVNHNKPEKVTTESKEEEVEEEVNEEKKERAEEIIEEVKKKYNLTEAQNYTGKDLVEDVEIVVDDISGIEEFSDYTNEELGTAVRLAIINWVEMNDKRSSFEEELSDRL